MACIDIRTRKIEKNGVSYRIDTPCGQCLPCRVQKRTTWTGRLLLEFMYSPFAYFVTLDYSDENLPKDLSVDPVELRNFLKRFRYYLGHEVRYFGVGEYGSETRRPHYHALIYSEIEIPVEQRLRPGSSGITYWFSDAVARAWPFGSRADCVPLIASADGRRVGRYVAGYAVKRATNDNGLEYHGLEGRKPEFSRMSLRPGIGLEACKRIGAKLKKHGIRTLHAQGEDLSVDRNLDSIRIGDFKWPLDRSMRKAIMDGYGGDLRTDVRRLWDAQRSRAERMVTRPTDIEQDTEVFHRALKRYRNAKKYRTL